MSSWPSRSHLKLRHAGKAVNVLAILRELKPLTGHARYMFPSVRTMTRPMSDGTINAALRRLGYDWCARPTTAQHLADRRKMMQAWADVLDGLGRKSEGVSRQLNAHTE